jgi:hypothetical protein
MKQILLLLTLSFSHVILNSQIVNPHVFWIDSERGIITQDTTKYHPQYDTIKIYYTFIDTSKIKIANYDGYRSTVQMWAYGYEVRYVTRELIHHTPWDCPNCLINIAGVESRYLHCKFLYLSKEEIPNNIIITFYKPFGLY